MANQEAEAHYGERWSDVHLDVMKHTGDELADATVAAIFARGDRDMVNFLLPRLQHPDTWPANTPPELKIYLDISSKLPNWTNLDSLRRAYAFLDKHAVRYNIVLLYLSLPLMNAWQAGGAQTLAMTGELSKTFARRLSETLRFVRAVVKDGSLAPTGQGICTTQKVRLMHATIRRFAHSAHCPGGANYFQSRWGIPINQEALTATLLAFSTVATEGMRKLSGDVSERDEDDMLHFWRVVGYVLGVLPDNMPDTVSQARWLWTRCQARNFGRTAAGVMLTKAHIDFMRDLARNDATLSAALKCTDEGLMRFLMGDDIAVGMLGVPDNAWTEICAGAADFFIRVVGSIVDHSSWLQHWLDHHAAGTLDLLQAVWDGAAITGHEPPRPFHVPNDAEAEGALNTACALNAGNVAA